MSAGPEGSKAEVVAKSAKTLRIRPNLERYDEVRRDFSWDSWRHEISWFEGGHVNAAYNAVDRHCLSETGKKTALIWASSAGKTERYTFQDMAVLTSKFANVLKSLGIGRGDRVFIFCPRIPEVPVTFLGAIKAGAVASTMFCAFGPDAVKDRMLDSGAKALVVTPDLKDRVDAIRADLPDLKHVIVVDNREDAEISPESGDISYSAEMAKASAEVEIAHMDPEEYAFMLYTSGTTGKPKGVVHAHMAILQQHLTTKWVLDLQEDDVYWCTADHGWVTGISYGILGPWSNGITCFSYEGRFDPATWYQLIDDFEITRWYTAPTAIRMLMQAGDELPTQFSFKSLRSLASVGEPLNPEAIRWGLKAFGLPFHDTWWQTETGAILICNYPSAPIKLGSMGRPFPGVTAAIIDDDGNELPAGKMGNLAVKRGWPSIMRTVWQNQERYDQYFIGDWFVTGDKAWQDEEGYFWFVGRADDVIKTAGERVGPFEVESALVEHPTVVEAGVIGKPDALRGEIIKAFVTLARGAEGGEELTKELQKHVKARLAGHAYPREIDYVDNLPKTRSGKIMRRLLKARELGLDIGDTSTLEDD